MNSGFEKAYENVYRTAKKLINSERSEAEIAGEIRKVIDEQREVTHGERLDLLNLFDKTEYRRRMLLRAIGTMNDYRLRSL